MPPEMSFAGRPAPVINGGGERAFDSFGRHFCLPCIRISLRKHLPTLSTLLTRMYGKKQEKKRRKRRKEKQSTARNVTTVTRHEALCIRTDPATFPTTDSYSGGIEGKGRKKENVEGTVS